MHSLLEKLLKKRKINDVSTLSGDEQETYKKWQGILNKDRLNIDDILKFCNSQLDIIDQQWKDLKNTERHNERLVIMRTVYKTIVDIVNAPRLEKENMEKYLTGLLTE